MVKLLDSMVTCAATILCQMSQIHAECHLTCVYCLLITTIQSGQIDWIENVCSKLVSIIEYLNN